ncbi:MAG: Ldh family oxidoreductase [Beijerinckiaceae bacterium]
MTDEVLVAHDVLKPFVAQMFEAAGMGQAHANMAADVLCWAEFRGVESHGVERIPRYLDLLANGQMNAKADIKVRDVAGAAFAIDADKASGLVAMTIAADEAERRAREFGVAMGLVNRTTHTGAIGYFADRAARRGFAAIVMAAGMPLMAYPGTRTPSISTSPLAIGVPGGPSGAMVLDMSTAIASNGRLKKALADKKPIPEGWALDEDGNPATDPAKATVSMPVGGAKGAGLSMMIEILASVLGGSPITSVQAPVGAKRTHTANGLIIVIDISRFRDVTGFAGGVNDLVDVLKGLPRFADAEPVRMPGERGAADYAVRMKNGTPLNARLRAALAARAKGLGVAVPQGFTPDA